MKRYILNDELVSRFIIFFGLASSCLSVYIFTGTSSESIIKEYGELMYLYRTGLITIGIIALFFLIRTVHEIRKFTVETEESLEKYINEIKMG